MSRRYLGVVSLERFLAVERYHESHQPATTQPVRGTEQGRRTDAAKGQSRAGSTRAKGR